MPSFNPIFASSIVYGAKGDAGPTGPGRSILSAARTYYVRTDGSDSNDGLSNTSGGAFLTIQKAVDVVSSIDLSTHQVTIQVGAGTYTDQVFLRPYVGTLAPIIIGDETTPGNVLLSTTSQDCVVNNNAQRWKIRGFKLKTTTSGYCILSLFFGVIEFQNISFDTGATGHINSGDCGYVVCTGNYSIIGGTVKHLYAVMSGSIDILGVTITLAGTPAFSEAYAVADQMARISHWSCTFSGSATGKRYSASMNSSIHSGGVGSSYFPGNVDGTTATGGQYL